MDLIEDNVKGGSKVLIVNGSKRRNGNSYALESYIAEKLAGNANVPGSIMEKEDDLKAADEMAAWLIG